MKLLLTEDWITGWVVTKGTLVEVTLVDTRRVGDVLKNETKLGVVTDEFVGGGYEDEAF